MIEFFTGLKLSKSQANSLLNQLADDWNEQYDTIAELIALQMIVYIDAAGWKVGKQSCDTWVFSTTIRVLFRYGVSRKQSEATAVLGEFFSSIGITAAAAYKSLFSRHQLSWAHPIRKTIKLALQNSDETEYAEFLDALCAIYDDARGLRDDTQPDETAESGTLVKQLPARVKSLCNRNEEKIIHTATSDHARAPSHLETFISL